MIDGVYGVWCEEEPVCLLCEIKRRRNGNVTLAAEETTHLITPAAITTVPPLTVYICITKYIQTSCMDILLEKVF